MTRVIAALIGAMLFLTQAALAEGTALDKALQKDPGRFADRVTDLIAGFGGPDGLRAEGVEDHIALERAGARAATLRRLMAMDLDADGVLDRAELSVSQRAANAATRGRMERQFAAADANGDGRVDQGEMLADGQAAALRSLSATEAEMLRELLTLDADGDGALTLTELDLALARIDDAT
jgi:EF hand